MASLYMGFCNTMGRAGWEWYHSGLSWRRAAGDGGSRPRTGAVGLRSCGINKSKDKVAGEMARGARWWWGHGGALLVSIPTRPHAFAKQQHKGQILGAWAWAWAYAAQAYNRRLPAPVCVLATSNAPYLAWALLLLPASAATALVSAPGSDAQWRPCPFPTATSPPKRGRENCRQLIRTRAPQHWPFPSYPSVAAPHSTPPSSARNKRCPQYVHVRLLEPMPCALCQPHQPEPLPALQIPRQRLPDCCSYTTIPHPHPSILLTLSSLLCCFILQFN